MTATLVGAELVGTVLCFLGIFLLHGNEDLAFRSQTYKHFLVCSKPLSISEELGAQLSDSRPFPEKARGKNGGYYARN